jgi:chromosomal replication initiation ATPase DnaA
MSNNDKLEILLFNVSSITGYSIEQIKSHWTKRKVTEARHAYCIVAKIIDEELSLSEIGRKIDRKHATVIWGIKNKHIPEINEIVQTVKETYYANV